MDDITIGKALIDDSNRLSILFKTIYIQTYAEEGITTEFANFIDKRFSIEHIEQTIIENPDQLLVAYYKNNPIGIAEIVFESKCPISKKTIPELSKLYVLERFKGKRIGYQLLLETEKKLKSRGYDEMYLEVYLKNIHAISFYQKMGFFEIGQVDFPMEHNVYQNLVLKKNLK